MNYAGRIQDVRSQLAGKEIDALLVTNLTNVRYLTGFSGTNGQILVSGSGAWFYSDPRYAARAADLVQGAEVQIYPMRLTDLLPERVSNEGMRRIGIEAATMTLAERDQIAGSMGDAELVPVTGTIEDLRRAKTPDEVALIREAVRIADEAFEWVLGRLRPGVQEREIALDLEIHMRREGAEGISFQPIVGSGPLSAHIHHTPGDREFQDGELVLLDFGARVDGYCSDLTRTVVLGSATDEQRALYELVLVAQRLGIEALAAGAVGAGVDAAARAPIDDAGHEEHFGHGLGHGVGLDIHEAPRLARDSEDVMRAGDVVTVEPGVYEPGRGGVRIEDCVLVGDDGREVLGKAPKQELIEVR